MLTVSGAGDLPTLRGEQHRGPSFSIRRRELVIALLTVATVPAAAFGQEQRKTIGVLSFTHRADAERNFKAFYDRMHELGWVEGRNVVFERRFAENQAARLPELAEQLVASKPDLIVCMGPAPCVSLKKLGTEIPALFVAVADPVGIGLAKSLDRPGGTFTGFATLAPELFLAKQIELLHETVPRATSIAFLTNPDNPVHIQGRELRLRVAKARGLRVIETQARTRDDLESAFVTIKNQRAEMMYLSGDPLATANRDLIADLALKQRLPVMFLFAQHVDAGGLMSYGTDTLDIYQRSATYADKILKGALARDLPIQEPMRYNLVINMRTARALGIKIPQSLLLTAERLIE